MMALRWSPEHSPAAYSNPFALFAYAVDILRGMSYLAAEN